MNNDITLELSERKKQMANSKEIIRFWKEENYRLGMTEAERATFPDNPAGKVDLSDHDLQGVAGGSTEHLLTLGCCSGFTTDPNFCC